MAAGAERTIPVRQFHWSSQNNHIARADGAVRLIAELARLAIELGYGGRTATPIRTVVGA